MQQKDVYVTSGAELSGHFGTRKPSNRDDCLKKVWSHMYYQRGDRSTDLMDCLSDGHFSQPADTTSKVLRCYWLLPDGRPVEERQTVLDPELLAGRVVETLGLETRPEPPVNSVDNRKRRGETGGGTGNKRSASGVRDGPNTPLAGPITQLFGAAGFSPPATQRSPPRVDPLDELMVDDDEMSLNDEFEAVTEENTGSSGNRGGLSQSVLDRLAFGASGAGVTSSDKTVGISADVLRNLTQDEHPILQNIMQVTAGLDFRVIPTPNSMGHLYAGLLKATKAPVREEMLIALLRPADWSSFDPHQPLTFNVLGSFDCAVAQVKSLVGTHLMVKVVKVINLGTGTQSVEHAVPWPAPHESARILGPQGVYLVPTARLREFLGRDCGIRSVPNDLDSPVDALFLSEPFTPASNTSGRQSGSHGLGGVFGDNWSGQALGQSGSNSSFTNNLHSPDMFGGISHSTPNSGNSIALLADPLNHGMFHNKNETQQQVVIQTIPLRRLLKKSRLNAITGNAPQMTCSYCVSVLMYNLDLLYVNSPLCEPSNPVCRIWEMHLFRHCSEEVQLSAFLLLFDPQRSLKPSTSVYLQYFQRCGVSDLPQMTHLTLRICLEGLEDFLELLLEWSGLFKDLLRAFRNGDLDIYTVDYLQCQIYGALALFNEKSRAEQTQLTDWEQLFRTVFSELRLKFSYEACQRYEKFKATSVGVPPSGQAVLTQGGAAGGSLSGTAHGRNTGVVSTAHLDHHRSQLCVRDVLKHFGLPQQNGQRSKPCTERCLRRHMSDLLRAPMPLSTALEQVRLVLKSGDVFDRAADAVRSDLSGRFIA
jgi:hypothetical protein